MQGQSYGGRPARAAGHKLAIVTPRRPFWEIVNKHGARTSFISHFDNAIIYSLSMASNNDAPVTLGAAKGHSRRCDLVDLPRGFQSTHKHDRPLNVVCIGRRNTATFEWQLASLCSSRGGRSCRCWHSASPCNARKSRSQESPAGPSGSRAGAGGCNSMRYTSHRRSHSSGCSHKQSVDTDPEGIKQR